MILLIDNYDSFTYNIYQYLCELGETVVVKYNDKILVNGVSKLNPQKIIISPGPGRPEQAGNCLKIIKKYYRKIPFLGICLGQQCLAQAFGAKIVAAREICHGRKSLLAHNRTGLFENLTEPLSAARYHSLAIEEKTLPGCFNITARAPDGEIMGIEHQALPLFGLQFHPESVFTPTGREILENFLKK